MKKAKFFRLFFTTFLLIFILFSPACKKKEAKKEEIIKIGAILPLTGGASEFGKYNMETTKMVLEDYKRKTGYNVEIYFEDSKSSPKDAINAYNALLLHHPDIQIISTELSSVSMSLSPLSHANKQLLMAIAATPKLSEYKNILRIYPTAESEMIAFRDAISKLLLSKNSIITIYYINDEFGQSVSGLLKQALIKDGFTIVLLEPFGAGIDIRSALIKHKSSNAFIIIGFGSPMGTLIKEIQTFNEKSFIICSPEFKFSDVLNFVRIPDKRLYYIDIPEPSDEILSLYQNQLHRSPNLVDMLVFDGLNILLNSLQKMKEERGKVPTGEELAQFIKNKRYNFYNRDIFVDDKGNVQYKLQLISLFNK